MSAVYFAAMGAYVKIGFTKDVPRRLQQLSRDVKLIRPADLEPRTPAVLIRFLPDCTWEDEAVVQRDFESHHVCGEFFRRSPALEREIARYICTPHRQRRREFFERFVAICERSGVPVPAGLSADTG